MENVIVCLQLFVFVHWFVKLDVVVDLVFTFLGLFRKFPNSFVS